jgi:glycosyltransferase involved in cell wall biosynthesis
MAKQLNKTKPTLTIGIPAHNEERNINNLIRSIFKQTTNKFRLEQVLVVCDGCTDNTVEVLKQMTRKSSRIKIVERRIRAGKADALNVIYKKTSTDFLMTIDADVMFIGDQNLDLLIDEMLKNPKLNLVGPRHIPTKSKTWFGNFARVSYQSFEDAFLKINNGNNFYGVMMVEMMRKKFYKSFTFPKATVSDQCFVYAKSIEKGIDGFKLVREAKVMFGTAQTFGDWRILSARSIVGDKKDVVKHFGKWVLKYYSMPRYLYIQSLIKWLFISPIYLSGSILMNIYIRKFPYHKRVVKNGMWELVNSSKEMININ